MGLLGAQPTEPPEITTINQTNNQTNKQTFNQTINQSIVNQYCFIDRRTDAVRWEADRAQAHSQPAAGDKRTPRKKELWKEQTIHLDI